MLVSAGLALVVFWPFMTKCLLFIGVSSGWCAMTVAVLGAAGAFMAGVSVLAKALGRVIGMDRALYPPV